MKWIFVLSCLFLFSGCATYKAPTDSYVVAESEVDPERCVQEKKAARHWLYCMIPRHRTQIRWYDVGHWCTWMLFGNDDDGIFGESQKRPYRPNQQQSSGKALVWWLRNPLHNFTFYTIGSAERENGEFTILNLSRDNISALNYRKKAQKNFGSKNSSFFLALHGGKPYVSLRIVTPWKRRLQFYFGWRERGNFGVKFQPFAKT